MNGAEALMDLGVSLPEERVQRLPQCIHYEANRAQSLMVQDIAAIKDEGRLDHVLHRVSQRSCFVTQD